MSVGQFPTIDYSGSAKGYDPNYEDERNGRITTLRCVKRSVQDSFVAPMITGDQASVTNQIVCSIPNTGVRTENIAFTSNSYGVAQQELCLMYDFTLNPQANQTPLQIANTGSPFLLYFMILENAGLGVNATNFEQVVVPPSTNKAFVNFTTPEDGVYRVCVRVRMIEQSAIQLSIVVDNTFVKTEVIHEPTTNAADPYLGTLDSRTDVTSDLFLNKGQVVRIAAEYVQNDTVSAAAEIDTAVLRIVQLASK